MCSSDLEQPGGPPDGGAGGRAAARPAPGSRAPALRRHAAAPQPRGRPTAPAPDPALRRADRRRGPAIAASDLRIARAAQPRGAHDHLLDPLHGGGRAALLPHRGDRPRQDPGDRHARRAPRPPAVRGGDPFPGRCPHRRVRRGTRGPGHRRARGRAVPLPAAAGAEAFGVLRPDGGRRPPPRIFASQRPTLEALFLHLTGRQLRD